MKETVRVVLFMFYLLFPDEHGWGSGCCTGCCDLCNPVTKIIYFSTLNSHLQYKEASIASV